MEFIPEWWLDQRPGSQERGCKGCVLHIACVSLMQTPRVCTMSGFWRVEVTDRIFPVRSGWFDVCSAGASKGWRRFAKRQAERRRGLTSDQVGFSVSIQLSGNRSHHNAFKLTKLYDVVKLSALRNPFPPSPCINRRSSSSVCRSATRIRSVTSD